MSIRIDSMLEKYGKADSEGRFDILINNYASFPGLIHIFEAQIEYNIKSEHEYIRSHKRGTLGVRVKSSNLSNPTEEEGIDDITIKESVETGIIDPEILEEVDEAHEYEFYMNLLDTMRKDYALLKYVIENIDEDDSRILKAYLVEKKYLKEIGDEEGVSLSGIKRRMVKIRENVRNHMLPCL